jgi:2,3-bisphosphoglycerate-independent phosphoglycerate mutase
MKYIIIVPDGMTDLPLKQLNNSTPMVEAKTPNMDKLAKEGIVGKVNNVPKGMQPGSDVANLSLLGYNPKECYVGRGPFEAKSIGIDLKEDEIAFRCNLVTIAENVMVDYSAGHITTNEAKILFEYLNKTLGSEDVCFYEGVSYRNLVIINKNKLKGSLDKLKCTPPHDILGKKIKKYLPHGKCSDVLVELMNESVALLEEHEVNKTRVDLGENPANMIWLWGFGDKPDMESFYNKFGIKGSIISAVGLLKGIADTVGIEPLDVPGITGYYDTDYDAKAEYAIKSLEQKDFVYIHVEAPDEAGHNGHIAEKIKAIENIDKKIVAKIVEALENKDDYRILIVPDHPTPIKLRTHTADDVPFILYGKGITKNNVNEYSERILKNKELLVYKNGYELVSDFLTKPNLSLISK